MTATVKAILADVLAGNAVGLESLVRVPHGQLMRAAQDSDLLVRPEAVAHVLRDLCRRSIDGKTAQLWASFVRRGYISEGRMAKGVKPLDIEYESAHEDAIIETIARLDEIGDVVDGDIPVEAEIGILLYSLGFVQ